MTMSKLTESRDFWRKTSAIPLDESTEVIGFSKCWIDKDFNPQGTRLLFRNETRWHTTYWSNSADEYIHIIYDEDTTSGLTTEGVTREDCIPDFWIDIPKVPKHITNW